MIETLSFMIVFKSFHLNNNNRSETVGLYCMRGSSKLSLHMKKILALSKVISPNQKSDEHISESEWFTGDLPN